MYWMCCTSAPFCDKFTVFNLLGLVHKACSFSWHYLAYGQTLRGLKYHWRKQHVSLQSRVLVLGVIILSCATLQHAVAELLGWVRGQMAFIICTSHTYMPHHYPVGRARTHAGVYCTIAPHAHRIHKPNQSKTHLFGLLFYLAFPEAVILRPTLQCSSNSPDDLSGCVCPCAWVCVFTWQSSKPASSEQMVLQQVIMTQDKLFKLIMPHWGQRWKVSLPLSRERQKEWVERL